MTSDEVIDTEKEPISNNKAGFSKFEIGKPEIVRHHKNDL
jgi:hypothetical protein